jgi:hypothetical protein
MKRVVCAMINCSLAALNVGLAVHSGVAISWAVAVFCFGCGLVVLICDGEE